MPTTSCVAKGNSAPKDWNTSWKTGTTSTSISTKIPKATAITAMGYIKAERILERIASFFSSVKDSRSIIVSRIPAASPACTMCT